MQGSPKDTQKIISWAQQQFQMMKNARAMTERQWKINLAFYFGRQNVQFRQPGNVLVPGQSGTLYVPPAPYYRARPVINRIRPILRGEISKLTSQKPTASIVPASNEDSDMYAARAGEQIWDSIWRRKKLKAVLRRTLFWTLACGSGFLKTYWDPNGIDVDADQQGDFCFDPITPFHVFCPDMRQEELEKQPFLIHAQLRPRESLQMQFPGLNINTKDGREDILEDSYLNLIGASNPDDKNTVMVLEVWVKAGAIALFPQGAMFTIVGDKIVQGGEGWPYQHGQYPFAKFDHIPSGKFYNDSSIVDLIPIQREYNRTRGQIIEAKNRMAKPQLIAPAGSVDPRKITTEPGIVIEYTPGFDPPQPIPLSPLPGYVLQELDRLLMDMSDISGQHEVSRGQTPPGVTAATAISYLQEQDESMLSPTFDSMEEGIENTAFMTLSLVSQFWDIPRMLKVVGTDGSFEVLSFRGADLRGNNDIRVEAGSSLPTSKAAKQAFIMDLMKMGFIPPDKGLEVMEIGGINKIYDEIQVDVREAQRENLKMARITQDQLDQFNQIQSGMAEIAPEKLLNPNDGQAGAQTQLAPNQPPNIPLIVPVNNWNNDQIHIQVHDKYRKSQDFDMAPPWVKQLFEAHVQAHVDKIVQGNLAQVPPEVTGQMTQNGIDPFTQSAVQQAQANESQGGPGNPNGSTSSQMTTNTSSPPVGGGLNGSSNTQSGA